MPAAIGWGLEGKPRQIRIFSMVSGGWIASTIRMRAPQQWPFKTSNPNDQRMEVDIEIQRASAAQNIDDGIAAGLPV